MNLKKAKKLRRKVYGDNSLRVDKIYTEGNKGQRLNTGLRAIYQQAKKEK